MQPSTMMLLVTQPCEGCAQYRTRGRLDATNQYDSQQRSHTRRSSYHSFTTKFDPSGWQDFPPRPEKAGTADEPTRR